MKLQYKHQAFQMDAARSVVDIFRGQPNLSNTYQLDKIYKKIGTERAEDYNLLDTTGISNYRIDPSLSEKTILENLNEVQNRNNLMPSDRLLFTGRYEPGRDKLIKDVYNISIEMETGVGKTYTYIKTIYELNKAYGWSKFIVMVPSIAIREGVKKSFDSTADHFKGEYGKPIVTTIYDSTKISEIKAFESDNNIRVMIINSQAFNATGKDARRIRMELDESGSIPPIELIAKTNPIIIMDEPQSLSGSKTQEGIRDFNPLMILRYSATHRPDEIYNMAYRLDALDAYNKKLVKKIEVKGISQTGTDAQHGYIFLDKINLSKTKNPTATLEFDIKRATGTARVKKILSEGDNLYIHSNNLEEYKDGYVISEIRGDYQTVEFTNGLILEAGEFSGNVTEDLLRRIQIRETIKSHLEKEQDLYMQGIKVLSLFFIDEVAKYKQYDENGDAFNGDYADIFEEEYKNMIREVQEKNYSRAYLDYLDSIDIKKTHAGYFSIDKKGKMVDSKSRTKKELVESSDVSAYDLIMKNKELLLDLDPTKSPVRFIFSHSALKEGWDNPNVFQIATLKQSASEVRKRQEVGRGMRLAVNKNGVRQDVDQLGEDGVHATNLLTIIASESYEDFAADLQKEISATITTRPRIFTIDLLIGKEYFDATGMRETISESQALKIQFYLIANGYLDDEYMLTEKFREESKAGDFALSDPHQYMTETVETVLNQIINMENIQIVERASNVELKFDEEKFKSKEFQGLWKDINTKTFYTVDFDNDILIADAINSIDSSLYVSEINFKVETVRMNEMKSKEQLEQGEAFIKESQEQIGSSNLNLASTVKYDLIGKIVENTGLTRQTVGKILMGIDKTRFDMFKKNPEEFIAKVSSLISKEIAKIVIQQIKYDKLDEHYTSNAFTYQTIRGRTNENVMKVEKHLFDYLKYDSNIEKDFAENLEAGEEVLIYVKLPSAFYIETPVGKYNPDWAIVFDEERVKHIYFIAETKGSADDMNLRFIENSKIACAKKHFHAISNEKVKFEVVDSYVDLVNIVK